MATTDMVPLLLGLLLAILAGIRTPSAIKKKNVPLWAAHVLVTVLILLAVGPIYSAVDSLLGGVNVANLLSRLLIGLIFLALGRQIANGLTRPDASHKIAGRSGLGMLALGALLVVLFFTLADTPTSSMGLNLYHDDPWVTAYRAAALLYPAYCSAILVSALYVDFRAFDDAPRIQHVAKGVLMAGFACVVPVPFLTLLEYVTDGARLWVDLFTYASVLLVAAGSSPALRTALMSRRQGRSRLAA